MLDEYTDFNYNKDIVAVHIKLLLSTNKGDYTMAQNPIVTIEMENGDIIKAELYPEIAPNTVKNFISLVKKGYYD